MTPDDFRRRVKARGYKLRTFAAHVGYSERQVGRWARGDDEIPRWVWVILDLMERVAA